MSTAIAHILRAKKLGVLIRDARLTSHKSIVECAEGMGTTPEQFEAYELGDQAPSLPELEMLSFYLQIPVEHFWGYNVLADVRKGDKKLDADQLIRLRQRLIGLSLRQARTDAGLSAEDLAARLNIEPAQLETYELAEEPIPLPVLESIGNQLRIPMRNFLDQSGPIGAWANQQRVIQEFLQMPGEMQAFVCKPINLPYLELAQRLSEMSVDKLRAVAEGLLEITL